MADTIEVTFEARSITARYPDGRAKTLADIPAAVEWLKTMRRTGLPLSLGRADAEGSRLAYDAAAQAGMRVEERDGQLFLLRPGQTPEALVRPDATDLLPASAKVIRGPVMLSIKKSLYNNSERAYQAVLVEAERGSTLRRFHNFGTGTFLRGSTAQGRIDALFSNLLDYGPEAIRGKLMDWVGFVHTGSADPVDRCFLAWIQANVDPRDIKTLQDRKWVMPYFRAWVLFRVAALPTGLDLGRTS